MNYADLTTEDVYKYGTKADIEFLREAYMGQDMKKEMAPKIKQLCHRYGVKGSLKVQHHSTIVFTIREGKINFMEEYRPQNSLIHRWEPEEMEKEKKRGYIQVNPYWFQKHFVGESLEFLDKVFNILNEGNHDNSDIQSDYFNIGWYTSVNIGEWDRPYKYTGELI